MKVPSDYKRHFSPAVFRRAEEYFTSGRVVLQSSDVDSHIFAAKGSEGRRYRVSVTKRNDGSFEAACTCPYRLVGRCKHIAAAILEGLDAAVFTVAGTNSNESVAAPEAKPGVYINLDTESPSSGISTQFLLRRFTSLAQPREPPTDTSRQHMVVFTATSYENSDYLRIVPELRYIRKDGNPGRFLEYTPGLKHRPLGRLEKRLLESHRYSNDIDIGILLRSRESGENVDLYRNLEGRRIHLRLVNLLKAKVTFRLRGLGRGNRPYFSPVLHFVSSPETDAVSVPAEDLHVVKLSEFTYFHAPYSTSLWYSSSNGIGENQTALFAGRSAYLTPYEIRRLSRAADGRFLEIEVPDFSIHIIAAEPALSIYLSSIFDGTEIHIMFRYGSRDIEIFENAPLVIGANVDGVLQVFKRENAMEEIRLDSVFGLLRIGDGFDGIVTVPMELPEFLHRFGGKLVSEGCMLYQKETKRPILPVRKVRISQSSEIDWLEIRVEIDGQRLSPGRLDRSNGLIEHDSHYAFLDEEALEKIQAIAALTSIEDDSFIIDRYDLTAIEDVGKLVNGDYDDEFTRLKRAAARVRAGFLPGEASKPLAMKGKLRDYQKSGVSWLLFLKEYGFGGILADDMGLGKTIQAIALIGHYALEGENGPHLIVAPVSTISNWVNELGKFLPGIRASAHIGPDRFQVPLDEKRGVIITSYHTLQRDHDLFLSIEWQLLVLDESQQVKNHRTKSHKAVRELKRKQTVAMSGTPVENNIGELWSIMHILNPGLLRGRTGFLSEFRKPIAEGDAEAADRLKRRINPFLLRRTKESVAPSLPEKKEIVVPVTLSTEEYAYYIRLRNELRVVVLALIAGPTPYKAAAALMAALTKLRQASIAPSLVGGPAKSSKLDTVARKISEGLAEGHKILVFSQFVKVLDLLKNRLHRTGAEYLYLDGSVPEKKRAGLIEAFQEIDGARLFLISLKAGGVGINLTEADYVFLIDPWWNPAVERQAVDRTHRIGQTRPVFAYRFLSEATIEERVVELQERKKELVDAIVGEDTSIFKTLSREEIVNLFS